MSDKLDNDLKNRIREVFDNYEDDTADAGWDLLRQRFPAGEKKRRVIAWWWYSAAAVLLLCAGTWFFYPQPVQQVAHQPKKHSQVVNDSTTILQEQIAANHQTVKPGEAENPATSTVVQGDKKTADALAQQTASVSQQHSAKIQDDITVIKSNGMLQSVATAKTSKVNANRLSHQQPEIVNEYSSLSPSNNKAQSIVRVKPQPSINNSISSEPTPDIKFDSKAQNTAKIKSQAVQGITMDSATNSGIVKNNAPQQVASVVTQTPIGQQKGDAVMKMIAADDARRQAIAKNAVKKSEVIKSDKAMLLSVYAATYFNYAKGSESQVNVGAGFTSDFKLSNNFKLSTGLAIAQNKLNYNSDNNVPQQINAKALANSTASNRNMVSASFAYDAASSVASSAPSVKNYNASLVGLDIPLNIKYQFNPQKNDTYILAGISSGTYINETYRSTLSYGNYYGSSALLAGVANNSQTSETTTNQHFSTFDFAKTLNVSFGIGYPVGKNNRLIIEPFLKYPLNGLGSQDIRFGASGVNLKLSFSGSKK